MTTVLVGRLCGPSELGVYSLGFAVIVLVSNLQDSLICGPFVVYRNWVANNRRSRYSGSAFVHQLVLSGIAAALLAVGAGTLGLLRMSGNSSAMIWTLAAVVPFASLYEFAQNSVSPSFRCCKRWHGTSLPRGSKLACCISFGSVANSPQ